MEKYLANCFLLLVPVFIWNMALFSKLPKGYAPENWDNVPSWVNSTELILRILAYLTPIVLVFSLQTKTQKIGFGLYITGLLIYFASWSMQIYYPKSNWSTSLMGFMALAFTPTLWLLAIGIIGQKSFVNIPHIRTGYFILAISFVIIHTYHSYLAYRQL